MISDMAGDGSATRDHRATWALVLAAAENLSLRGRTPFKLSDLIADVQLADPTRGRGTIQPVVQGMTENAGKGPASPCGKVLLRVDHGLYTLRDAVGVPAARRPQPQQSNRRRRARTLGYAEVRGRVDALVADFDRCVETYDASVPFTRSGQYQFHRQTIDRRRTLGSVDAAIHDEQFIGLLHETLQHWGIGRRASRLAPMQEFHRTLVDHSSQLHELEALSLEHLADGLMSASMAIDRLISDLDVVDNRARIVAGTKTLHHLLPDLVPPMDRAWTGAFFGWSTLDPQNNQSLIFEEAFAAFAEIARLTRPARLVGAGWRTSPTKVLDNALIGYCKSQGIGGTAS